MQEAESLQTELRSLIDRMEATLAQEEVAVREIEAAVIQVEGQLAQLESSLPPQDPEALKQELEALADERVCLESNLKKARKLGLDGLQAEIEAHQAALDDLGSESSLQDAGTALAAWLDQIDAHRGQREAHQETRARAQQRLRELDRERAALEKRDQAAQVVLARWEQLARLRALRASCLESAWQIDSLLQRLTDPDRAEE